MATIVLSSEPKQEMDMNIDEAFGSFIKAADFDKGDGTFRSESVIMDSVEMVELDENGVSKSKVALSFTTKSKSLVLNKTNAEMIKGAYGSDTNNWGGKAVTLVVEKAQFGGQMVNAVRVKIPDNAAQLEQPGTQVPVDQPGPGNDEGFDDDIPF